MIVVSITTFNLLGYFNVEKANTHEVVKSRKQKKLNRPRDTVSPFPQHGVCVFVKRRARGARGLLLFSKLKA